MGYNHQSGRSNERDIVQHLRRQGFCAADMATEKGIGQITEEDILAWTPGYLPSPLWHRGREHWTDHLSELQAKWSKNCTSFKSLYNRHRREGVSVGCCPSNRYEEWAYGVNTAILWADTGIYTGGINAWSYDLTHDRPPEIVEVDNRMSTKVEGWVRRADAAIMRGPKQPFLVAWEPVDNE